MDLTKAETWSNGLRIILDAPHIVVPLLILVAGAVWWFRGTIESAAKEGLKERNSALDEQRKLAEARQKDVQEKLSIAEKRVDELEQKVAAGASREQIADAGKIARAAISETLTANTQLGVVLKAEPGRIVVRGHPAWGTSITQPVLPLRADEQKK
jgi:hypothetical protein